MGSIPGRGRSLEGGHGNPLQYPCLENPRDGGDGGAAVNRAAKSQTRLKWLSTGNNSNKHSFNNHNYKPSQDDYGERNGNPLQYSCLQSSMERGAWQASVHGVTKSWTWLSQSLSLCLSLSLSLSHTHTHTHTHTRWL